jgi:hypothetical protein
LKKRTKKLLIPVGLGNGIANAHRNQSFFPAFFSKKAALTSFRRARAPAP